MRTGTSDPATSLPGCTQPGSFVCTQPGRVVCTLPLSWGTHPKVACNSPGSVFDTAYKRCNSNDAISMFEIVARELHATLARNHWVATEEIRQSSYTHVVTSHGVRDEACAYSRSTLRGLCLLSSPQPGAGPGEAEQGGPSRQLRVDADGSGLGEHTDLGVDDADAGGAIRAGQAARSG